MTPRPSVRLAGVALAFLVLGPSAARGLSRGTTGADFLKISNGVRAVAMGSSYVAVGEDVYSLYWNPAGIAHLEAPEFAGSYVKLFDEVEGVALYTGALEMPNFPLGYGNMGIGFMALTTGSFDSTDPQALVRAASGSASDTLVFVSYGAPVLESVSAGLSVKLVQRTLSGADPDSYVLDPVSGDFIPTRSLSFQATGMGADLGLLWESPERTLSIGGAVQNIGQMGAFGERFSMSFNQMSEPLPITFRIGGAWRTRFFGQALLATGDLTSFAESFSDPKLSVGLEYGFAGLAFVRAGWEQPLDAPFGRTALDFGDRSGLAALPSPFRSGLGFRWKISPGALVQFDYALAPFGTLGSVHHAALLLRWNIPKVRKAVTEKAPVALAKKETKTAMVIEPKQLKFERPVKEWKVEITDDKGRVVKTFAGTGLPPKSLDWDGTDERGTVVADTSRLKFVMKAKDMGDKEVKSSTQIASVAAEPQLKAVSGKALYPEVVFALPEGNYQLWQLKVQDAGRLVRSWEGQGRPRTQITWDGRDERGKVSVLKNPRYSWQFVDEDGRKTAGEKQLPQVDAVIRPEAAVNRVRMIGIRFRGEGDSLTEDHEMVMRKAAKFIQEHPGSVLTVESYSDVPGGDEANYDLARRRADLVMQSLMEKHRLSADRVAVRVYGRSKVAPAYPNLPAEEQRQRVDLVIRVRR